MLIAKPLLKEARPYALLRDICCETSAVPTVSEQMRVNWEATFLEGIDEQNAILRADDRIVHAFKEEDWRCSRRDVLLSREIDLQRGEL